MKKILLLTFVLFAANSFAQKPWRAKLFIHFLDSNNKAVTDTIWFGLDSLGDEGYQEGLDVFDTDDEVNTILSHDSLVQNQFNTYCGNLKYNIKKMNYGVTTFDFYALGRIMSMSWDSLDFLYEDTLNQFFLQSAWLTTNSGFLGNIDRDNYSIISRYVDKNYYLRDSILAFSESPRKTCNRNNWIYNFKLNVGFVQRLRYVGVNDIPINDLTVYPNPFSNNIYLSFKNEAFVNKLNIKIYTNVGLLIKEILINSSNNFSYTNLNLEELVEGIYIMTIEDETNRKVSYHKMIKSNF